MPDFSSNHGQILLALQKLVKDLQPENLAGEEVEVRGSYLLNGEPIRGVSIYDMGEQGNDGTVGTMDIGYVCGIVFAELNDFDARMSSDQMPAWRELVRRRCTDQRLPVTITNGTAPSEHVMKVLNPGEVMSTKKNPNYSVKRITVVVWLRELPTT